MDNSSKAKSVELLQTTIEQLQNILERINQDEEKLPNLADLEKLCDSTQSIAQQITLSSPTPAPNRPLIIDKPEDKQLPTTPKEVTPSTTKSKLPLIIGAIIAVVIVGVSTVILKFTSPEVPKEIATDISPETEEIVENPPPVVKPSQPRPKIEPTPPPKLETIPEQGLIAAIQTEVTDITNKYTETLIKGIEADFLAGLLIIEVGEDWYTLTKSQQQTIANEILARSQVLDFRKLELRDSEGVKLARNPVVGQNMVMLQ